MRSMLLLLLVVVLLVLLGCAVGRLVTRLGREPLLELWNRDFSVVPQLSPKSN